MRTDESATR